MCVRLNNDADESEQIPPTLRGRLASYVWGPDVGSSSLADGFFRTGSQGLRRDECKVNATAVPTRLQIRRLTPGGQEETWHREFDGLALVSRQRIAPEGCLLERSKGIELKFRLCWEGEVTL